jgi:hypothetical protein
MQKKRKLGRGVAIVGAGMSKFAMFKDKDSKDLFGEAFREMMPFIWGILQTTFLYTKAIGAR